MDVTMHWLQGPQSHLIYATCHWVSIFKFWKHLKPVFNFHHPHPFFWVFESWKQWSKTPPNRCSSVRPIGFGWWIMKTEWYHSIFIPSKQALICYFVTCLGFCDAWETYLWPPIKYGKLCFTTLNYTLITLCTLMLILLLCWMEISSMWPAH